MNNIFLIDTLVLTGDLKIISVQNQSSITFDTALMCFEILKVKNHIPNT